LIAPFVVFGALPILAIWAVILAIPILWSVHRLNTGPVWYR